MGRRDDEHGTADAMTGTYTRALWTVWAVLCVSVGPYAIFAPAVVFVG